MELRLSYKFIEWKLPLIAIFLFHIRHRAGSTQSVGKSVCFMWKHSACAGGTFASS